MDLHPDIERVLISEQEIQQIVQRIGAEISRDYADKDPLLVCVLRGAFVYTADLLRAITIPCEIDFMAATSYLGGTKSTGVLRILKDLETDVEGRHVIIAEDILDSGLTLKHIMGMLRERGCASISIAAFSVKETPNRVAAVEPRYVGTTIPDEFIVGYGLDYQEHYRNLPYIGVLKHEVYDS